MLALGVDRTQVGYSYIGGGAVLLQVGMERAEADAKAVEASVRSALAALVHVQLARVALDQLDLSAAHRQLERALEHDPTCLDAASLLVAALGDGASAARRLRAERISFFTSSVYVELGKRVRNSSKDWIALLNPLRSFS